MHSTVDFWFFFNSWPYMLADWSTDQRNTQTLDNETLVSFTNHSTEITIIEGERREFLCSSEQVLDSRFCFHN